MTDDEIRIAVAESVGWQRWRSKAGKVALRKPTEETAEYWRSFGCEITTEEITEPFPKTFPVPDYPNDLNAIGEAVEGLRKNQFHFVDFPKRLFQVVTGLEWTGDVGYFFFNLVNATASQRCEAYLRTIGRWKE